MSKFDLTTAIAATRSQRDALSGLIDESEITTLNQNLAGLQVTHDALIDRIKGRQDRCPCHDSIFNPDTDEGRGPGTCAECEADTDALTLAEGEAI